MVSVCLPSDALSQHLPSHLGFSHLGGGESLHGCSSKAQPLLLTLDKGYPLNATPPDLERGVATLGCSCTVAAWHAHLPPLTSDVGSSSQNDLCSFPRQIIQYHSNPSLCPNQQCWRSCSWTVLWRPTRPFRTNSQKRCHFHYGDWNPEVGSHETPGVTGKSGLGVRNEAGQRLIEFCQEKRSEKVSKVQFSFQCQRKAMPKNAQTTAQLHSSHMLVK